MNKKTALIRSLCLIIIILTISVAVFRKQRVFKLHEISEQSRTVPSRETLTSSPYYNLTIPALRARRYTSTLGTLKSVSDTSDYTSYLTSYTSDGLRVNGLLTIPAGDTPKGGWPAIVFVHGYIPPRQYETVGRAYTAYVDYLARNGFVVFKIDLRGHGESEGVARGGYYSADYVIDTLNAYAALQSSPLINSRRIGLWGHSMAGNIVMRSFAARPHIPAVVIWAGAGYTYTDLSRYKITDPSYQPRPTGQNMQNAGLRLRDLYDDPIDGNPFWKMMAPASYLNDLTGAIQIHHAVDDETVNIAYSRDLNSLLNLTSVRHEFYEYPVGGHNISSPSFEVAMQRTVAFFKKYLL